MDRAAQQALPVVTSKKALALSLQPLSPTFTQACAVDYMGTLRACNAERGQV